MHRCVSIVMSNYMLERLSWFMIVPAIPIFIILNSISGKIGFNDTIHTAHSQPEPTNRIDSNTTQSVGIKDMTAEKVHVGGIDIAYEKFGSGDPILLISPAQGDMNSWDPSLLSTLSSNRTVVLYQLHSLLMYHGFSSTCYL
jgi:hypothetical protein